MYKLAHIKNKKIDKFKKLQLLDDFDKSIIKLKWSTKLNSVYITIINDSFKIENSNIFFSVLFSFFKKELENSNLSIYIKSNSFNFLSNKHIFKIKKHYNLHKLIENINTINPSNVLTKKKISKSAISLLKNTFLDYSTPIDIDRLTNTLTKSDKTIFVDELYIKNVMVGISISYKISESKAYLYLLAIKKNYQGFGYGKDLLCFVENRFYNCELNFSVYSNEKAYGFYMKQHYIIESINHIIVSE